jgi:hypothetical protein
MMTATFNETIFGWIVSKDFIAKLKQQFFISMMIVSIYKITQFSPQNTLINGHKKTIMPLDIRTIKFSI